MESCVVENHKTEKKEEDEDDNCDENNFSLLIENNNNTDISNNNSNNTTSSSDSHMNIDNNDNPNNNEDAQEEEKNEIVESETPVPIGPVYLPPHLMGRDLNNPAEDVIGTRRRVQKPRLGVKVPYRNLTSQIVSQDEIAQELLERSLRKYSYHDVPERGDVFFAMKLTHRLANKISSSNDSLSPTKETQSKLPFVKIEDGHSLKVIKSESKISCSSSNTSSDKSTMQMDKQISSTIDCAEQTKPSMNNHTVIEPDMEKKVCNVVKEEKNLVSADVTGSVLMMEKTVNLKNESFLGIKKINMKPSNDIPLLKNELSTGSPLTSLVGNSSLTCSSNVNNSSLETSNVNEMDNETLIAILEGTAEMTDVISPPIDKSFKRKKLLKRSLDPNLERELALKQLEDFETTKRRRRSDLNKSGKKPKLENSPNDNTNNNEEVSQLTSPVNGKTRRRNITQKMKHRRIISQKYDSVPKRLPKKYQRIIKKQLRNSKLKSKNVVNNSPDVQKKLPEVPEVQIAIDQYIKTYTNKRKQKPLINVSIANATDTTANATTNATIDANVITTGDTNVTNTITDTSVTNTATDANVTNIAVDIISNSLAVTDNTSECIVDTTNITTASGTFDEIVQISDATEATKSCDIVETKETELKQPELEEPRDKTKVETNKDTCIVQEYNKPNKKTKKNVTMMREINRLLGDEGAINMIYSVEQKRVPDSQNAYQSLPSLRRKKKDLVLKTKLVKNAVLRLSMSPAQIGSGRIGRRKSPEPSRPKKMKLDSPKKFDAQITNPVVLAKSRKAAEESKIIRRHSSSSSCSDDESSSSINNPGAYLRNVYKDTNEQTNQTVATENAILQELVHPIGEPGLSDAMGSVKNKRENLICVPLLDVKTKTAKSDINNASYRNLESANTGVKKQFETNAAVCLEHVDKNANYIDGLHELTVRRYDTSLVKIILTSRSTKMKNGINIQILNEMTTVLMHLEKDPSCHAVLVTSTGGCFCQGIDLISLIHSGVEERQKIAECFVSVLTTFIKCLANFQKPIIAGVHGAAVGLGVTLLPYFDMIFASDKATFYTPYAKLGQIPEGGAALTLPTLLGTAVTNELLFGCRMLTAAEALQFGLITRILWPDKFNEELLSLSKGVARQSLQSLQSTKFLLRQEMRSKLDATLEQEQKYLIKQWCSDECQINFKRYLKEEAICTTSC